MQNQENRDYETKATIIKIKTTTCEKFKDKQMDMQMTDNR